MKNLSPYWQPVIGLEIHAILNTKTKLFSRAPNTFGSPPNTNITPHCTGQPGALPVLNRAAVQKALLFGCAIEAEIALTSQFDRKNYFYPDNPRNYQITQYFHPLIKGGTITADISGIPVSFDIKEAHLEDDAATLKHFDDYTAIDFNRAGAPLLEIVSQPCISSPQEAVAYAKAVKTLLEYLDISNCNMSQGSLRIDANISIKNKADIQLRPKAELKNLNSFYNLEHALHAAIKQQIDFYQKKNHAKIPSATYRWNAKNHSFKIMRLKETAADYRYFPEPDLPLLRITASDVERVKETMPELPLQRLERLTSQLGLNYQQAIFLVENKELADYFEEALGYTSHHRQLYNWITIEFAGKLKDNAINIAQTSIPPSNIAQLVNLIEDRTITGKMAKKLADMMIASPLQSPQALIEQNPEYQVIIDENAIKALIDQVLKDNPHLISDYHQGKQKVKKYLVGQVMKLSRGQASPIIVDKLLSFKLSKYC
ncbi:MAG: Asp-tRNA(Asn)/Glu-tRNA(Gln) amidotransferase subunit GatB [Chlamydiota bacterium]